MCTKIPAESDGVNLAASGQSQSHLQATRRPALDSRTSVLLHQLNATKNALQQAAARIDVVDDDDGVPGRSSSVSFLFICYAFLSLKTQRKEIAMNESMFYN